MLPIRNSPPIHDTPVHTSPPPLIEVAVLHLEMGCQIGEACRPQVKRSIENAHMLIDQSYSQLELTWDGAHIQARKYLPFAEERYPQYVEEMRGIAEGANVSFDDVVTLNTMEAVTTDALHLTRCTSFAVNDERTADGHVLVAHNEDWVPEDEDDVYVISARPREEVPFLAMTYGGLLPNVGFNAHGIAQLIDSVYPTDSRIGIPRLVVARAILASRRISAPSDARSCRIAPPATIICSCMKAANFIPSKSRPAALIFYMGWMATWCIPTTTFPSR